MDRFTECIRNGKTKEAIDCLLEQPLNQKTKDEVLLVSAQFEEVESKNRKGLLSLDAYTRQVNIVNSALVDIYRKRDSKLNTNETERYRFRIVRLFLLVLISLLVAYYFFTNRDNSIHQFDTETKISGKFDTTEIDLTLLSELTTANSTLGGHPISSMLDQKERREIEATESIQIPPDLPATEYFNLGRTFSENDKYSISILYLTKAILDSATFSAAYIERGFCNRKLGDYEEAVADYSKSINLDINQANAYLNRGVVYFLLLDLEKAEDDGNAALRINPNLPQGYNLLGNIRYVKEDYEAAVTSYKKAIEKRPLYRDAYYGLSMSYFLLGKDKEACEAQSMALKLGISEKVNPYYITKCK